MEIQIKGVITNILPRQDKTDKNGRPYSTQEVAVEDLTGQYKRTVSFTIFANENHPRLRDFIKYMQVGNTIFADCDIISRLSKDGGRYFTEIMCYNMGHYNPQQY